MDNLEKVEKLRERANVSYEEAKAALEESDWDLLDAMVKLEKSGKTAGPRQSDFRTSAETQEDYVAVKDKVMEQQNKKVHVGRTLGDVFRSFFRVCRDNAFCVNRAGEQVFRLPLIAMLVILLFTWKILIPVMIIALFFGFRYSFEGKDELKDANKFMDTAGNVVESFKEGWNNAGQKKNDGQKNDGTVNGGFDGNGNSAGNGGFDANGNSAGNGGFDVNGNNAGSAGFEAGGNNAGSEETQAF